MSKAKTSLKKKWELKFRKLGFGVQEKVSCNLCGMTFKPSSRFVRYCDSCREENEIYKHAGWALYS